MAGRYALKAPKASKIDPTHTYVFATALAIGTMAGTALPATSGEAADANYLTAKLEEAPAAPAEEEVAQATEAFTAADEATSLDAEAADMDLQVELPPVEEPAPAAAAAQAPAAQAGATTQAAAVQAAPAASGVRQGMVAFARQFTGVRYAYGQASPAGFDCSGLVSYVYGHFGYAVPHSSHQIIAAGYRRVSAAEAKPGDILWWPGHVSIYTGNGMQIGAMYEGVREQAPWGSPVYLRVIND